MGRLLVIDECTECSNCWVFAGTQECSKMDGQIVPDDVNIPDWCPLPDETELI